MRKLLLFCILVTIGLTSCIQMETNQSTQPAVSNNQSNTEVKKSPKEQPKEQPKDIILKSGNYVIGTDIPVGVYTFTVISGNGNVDTSDFSLIAIMGVNESFQKEYKNVYLKKGITLRIQGVELNLKYIRDKN